MAIKTGFLRPNLQGFFAAAIHLRRFAGEKLAEPPQRPKRRLAAASGFVPPKSNTRRGRRIRARLAAQALARYRQRAIAG